MEGTDNDDDKILDDNLDIAPPSETTYHVTCYMTRNTTSTRTLAHYDVFTSFTTPANTNSFLDNAHYQHIKTEARRKMLTREPLKSLILDGVSIQLHVPQVYYEIRGGDKQQVPLPLSPESMASATTPRRNNLSAESSQSATCQPSNSFCTYGDPSNCELCSIPEAVHQRAIARQIDLWHYCGE